MKVSYLLLKVIINKLPFWVQVRSNIIKNVFLESAIFWLLYLSILKYLNEKYISINSEIIIINFLWIISSYVIGRYSSIRKKLKKNNLHKNIKFIYDGLLAVLCTIFFTSCTQIVIKWIPIYLLKNNLLYRFLFFLGFICSFVQIIINIINRGKVKHHSDENWLFIGNFEKGKDLINLFKKEKINLNIIYLGINNEIKFKKNLSGIIIEDIKTLNKKLVNEIAILRSKNIEIISIVDICEMKLQRYPPHLINGIEFSRPDFLSSKYTFQLRIKRLADISISIFLLLITFPIILISCILIKIEDRGSIFYKQTRTGINGNKFLIVKLRTMRVDAEKNGARWALKNDTRITKIGKILRKTRIDELPQLITVIEGKLSLIGPRPERPEFDKKLIKKISYYQFRTLIKPGLSGWAQVNYPYGASLKDSENKLSFDLYYIRHFNIFLDLLIAIKTIKLISNASGSEPLPTDL